MFFSSLIKYSYFSFVSFFLPPSLFFSPVLHYFLISFTASHFSLLSFILLFHLSILHLFLSFSCFTSLILSVFSYFLFRSYIFHFNFSRLPLVFLPILHSLSPTFIYSFIFFLCDLLLFTFSSISIRYSCLHPFFLLYLISLCSHCFLPS